ncbi:VOC family protein [Gordonia neofelifaecis]|uniref:VOC domain-containing protein n=1 Tax=Gordonia neofelifaecis NRRL B-59395 TaxID=644548 RepID=F1YP24_9ACTN|nr:VOC family protein [Gordonia neofelifaecis]EGD53529.1 hypothetical protein SCNU_18432 [Gordonia neofelifaecis NRRL B-59395]
MTPISDPLAVSDVHVSLPVADAPAARAVYDLLLGDFGGPPWRASNASVGLADPQSPLTIDLRVADLARAADLLRRRGLRLDESDHRIGLADATPLRLTDSGRTCPDARMLDHIVLTVADSEQAIALFGGRLGISLRLVRDLGDGISQLFFRTGSAVIEVVAGAPDAGDGIGLMGMAWRSDDIVAEQRRLADAGLNISEVRTGRKPGTRVCTIRESALGTATLLIQQ